MAEDRMLDLLVRRAHTREKVRDQEATLLPRELDTEADRRRWRRACIAAVATAVGKPIDDDTRYMPWLSDYVIEVRKHNTNDVLFTYRDFGGAA